MTQHPECPSCGTPLPPGASNCVKCGANIVGATAMMSVHDTPTLHHATPPTSGGAAGGNRNTGGMLTQARMMDALRAATLGEYEILAELGRGGMATVYLAHDISLDRKVAIKVMSPALLDGDGAIERFKREARTAGALSHPHVIQIYAVKESGDLLYFVMKYVEGRPLDDVVREQGALPIPMVVQILTEVSGALAYAHRKNVIHRDVKPANIMLDDDGWAVVTDFGIAKLTQKQGLTMTGTTVGTPAYMSPEQCAAKDVSGRSDQYSLGIVGFELLAGRVPFAADSLMGMFLAQMNDAPSPILEVRPDCPPLLATIVERMMAKAPEARWPSLDDVVRALGPLQKTEAQESTRVSMAVLARVSDGRPRPDDFARPLSPMPRNGQPVSSGAPVTVPPSAVAPVVRRIPKWAWGAAAVPVLVAGAWLAMQGGRGDSLATTPPSLENPNANAGAPGVPSSQQGAVQPTSVIEKPVPSNTRTTPRDSALSANNAKKPATTSALPTPGTTSKLASDTTHTQVAAPDVTKKAAEPALPIAVPAGNSRTDSAVADPNAGAPSFTEISAGGSTTCGALANEGGVVCWGGASPTGAMLQGVLFQKISVGDGHICGLTPAGEAFCWGSNSQGQLGDGSTADRPAPTAVKATQKFSEISVGAGHTCALSADGTAFCWGGNKYGQLGDGSRSNRNRPVLVRSTAGNQGFQSLAAGGSHTCGITRANKAFCWGDGFSGQVGNAMQDFAQEPFAVKTDLAFRTVVAGDRHTCGLTTSGRVYCWGENKQGQLGNETKDDRNVPDSVATDQVFRAIGAGGQHTCGISNRRQLLCWGNNVDGRLGDGTRSARTVPVVAANGQTFSLVSAGSGHTCALMTNSHAMCWGGNARGQLGGGSASPFSASPVVVKVKGS